MLGQDDRNELLRELRIVTEALGASYEGRLSVAITHLANVVRYLVKAEPMQGVVVGADQMLVVALPFVKDTDQAVEMLHDLERRLGDDRVMVVMADPALVLAAVDRSGS